MKLNRTNSKTNTIIDHNRTKRILLATSMKNDTGRSPKPAGRPAGWPEIVPRFLHPRMFLECFHRSRLAGRPTPPLGSSSRGFYWQLHRNTSISPARPARPPKPASRPASVCFCVFCFPECEGEEPGKQRNEERRRQHSRHPPLPSPPHRPSFPPPGLRPRSRSPRSRSRSPGSKSRSPKSRSEVPQGRGRGSRA